MKVSKKLVSLFVFVAMGAALASCGAAKPGDNKSASENTVTSKKVDTTNETAAPVRNYAELAIGDQIKTDFIEITIDEAGLKPDLKTSIKSGNATHISGPGAEAGYQYAYIRGTIKNISKSELNDNGLKMEAILDDYSYTNSSSSIIESNGSSVFNLSPLATYTYTLYVKIPDEIASNHKSFVIHMGFNEGLESVFTNDMSELKYAYEMSL